MSSALIYFIFAGSNISFSGSPITFPGIPSTLSIAGDTIHTPIIDLTVNQSTSTPAPEIQTRRPDYTYTPDIGSHKVHTNVTTWIKARKICQDEGAHLAVINSRAEANVIAQLFQNAGPHAMSYSPNDAWIGTHDLISQQGDYETIFGESLAQAGFDEWHEVKSHEAPHCGSVNRDSKLSWFHCSRALGFICELPLRQRSTLGNGANYAIPQDLGHLIRERMKAKLSGINSITNDGVEFN